MIHKEIAAKITGIVRTNYRDRVNGRRMGSWIRQNSDQFGNLLEAFDKVIGEFNSRANPSRVSDTLVNIRSLKSDLVVSNYQLLAQ